MARAYHIFYVSLDDSVPTYAAALQECSEAVITSAYIDQALSGESREMIDLVLLDGTSASLAIVGRACQQLRKRFSQPLLVVVSDASEADLVNLYRLGVEECIIKPQYIKLLAAKVHSWRRWSIVRSEVSPRPQYTRNLSNE